MASILKPMTDAWGLSNFKVTIRQLFIKMAKSPFCSFPIFFGSFLAFLLNWQKLGLKASDSLPVLAQKAFKSLIRKKVNVTSQEGFFATKQGPAE
jgi:hypothetical protein